MLAHVMNGARLATLLITLAQAAQERSIGDVFRPGDESHWVIEQEGKGLGHCSSRYEGEVELGGLRLHAFRARVAIELELPSGAIEQRFTTDLWTDARGHPQRFRFQSRMGDVYARVDGALSDGKAELEVRQGPSESTLQRSVPADAHLLANNFVSHLELVLALDPPAAGATREYTFFSANALAGFPLKVTHLEERASVGPRSEPGAVYQDSLGERLHLTRGGRLELVEIPAQKIAIRSVSEPFPEFSLEPPEAVAAAPDLEREDVTIVDGDVSLAGTITRPKGASGRLPALFFISGSGGQDRDGVSAGIDLGTREILDRLTQDGFLVLRVDDRGVGGSKGPLADMTFDDLVEDAARAVRFLLGRPDVDPARVALIGHSEGGVSAPLLAARFPLAAIVLMAAPGRPIDALLFEQLRHAREQAGASEEELAGFDRQFEGFIGAIAKGEELELESLPPELRAFAPARAWVESHLSQDPLANLRAVHCPVLILQGERDIQVSAERDAPLLAQALDEAGHGDHELVVFEGLDHLFKRTPGEVSSELDYLKARPVAPEFLEKISSWLEARLMAGK